MSHYDDTPEDLTQDTKQFLASDFGRHITSTLKEMADGYLAGAANVDIEHPERYAAKYSAIKEVLNLINSAIDDDIPSHG